MLDDGIYWQVNNYTFWDIAAIFNLLQFCSNSVIYMSILRSDADIYIYIYIYGTL